MSDKMKRSIEAPGRRGAMPAAVVPRFAIEAQPVKVPPALAKMPAESRVTFERAFGARLIGTMPAGELCDEIRGVISRQADGFFTLHEAAQVLADSRPGLDPMEAVKRFRLAHSKGELPIHRGGSRFPLAVGKTVRDFWDTVEVSELDAWLRASTGYGFPMVKRGSVRRAKEAVK